MRDGQCELVFILHLYWYLCSYSSIRIAGNRTLYTKHFLRWSKSLLNTDKSKKFLLTKKFQHNQLVASEEGNC